MFKRTMFVVETALVALYAVSSGLAGEIEASFKAKLLSLPPDSVVSALIFVQAKVDLASLVAQFDAINADRATRNRTVLTALQDKANLTQGLFLAYLATQKSLGEIKAYQGFWIDNVISAQGKARAILAAENISNITIPYKIKENIPVTLRDSEPGTTTLKRSLTSITAAAESNLKYINAHRAWDMGLHGEGRLVCIFDTGADLHLAFANRWRGNQPGVPSSAAWFDPFNQTTQPQDFDSAPGTGNWHGTHVTGIAVGMNSPDTLGVAWGAQWIAAYVVRVGTLDLTDFADQIISAYQWAINPDGNPNTLNDVPDVINNSWGTDLYGCDDTFWGSIDAVEAAGIVNIIAVANTGPGQVKSPESRISNEYVNFGVGNINTTVQPFQIWQTSGLGPSPCAGSGNVTIKPEVVAPGRLIRSARRTSDYATLTGTSQAAPHISGTVALMRQANPNLTVNQIKQILFDTATDYGSSGNDNTYGYGMINAYQAVLMAYAYQNKSMSATATAANNGRRLVKDSSGKYHLVFESGITSGGNVLSEVFYRRSNVGGASWDPPIRLSAGNEQNRYSGITERSGKLYGVWQRKTGTNTYDILFRHFNGTSWEIIKTVTSGVSVTNDPLPVIASPNTSELMAVYRSGNNLEWKRSTNDGGAWPTSGTLNAGSGETLNSPSVGATITPWSARRTGLAYATKEIPNASHIITRYHDGSAWSASNNISSSLPGSLSQHAHPSLAPSGDAASPWYVHVAWDAYETGNRVIIHRLASTADWNFGSQYYQLHYQTEDRPSISGLAGNTAHMVYQRGIDFYHLNAHFNGSGWSVQFPAISGFHPSLSIGSTATKYVWTDGTDSPYNINLSASSFQKPANSDSVFVDYHRSVTVVDTTTSAWFDVRVEGMTITTTAGTRSAISLIDVDPSSAITPANAFDGLSSQSLVVPATAESLIVSFAISGDKLSVVKNNASPLQVELMAIEKGGKITTVPVFLTNAESFPKTNLTIALAATAFDGKEITLKPQVTGIAGKSSLVASLGHIYEITGSPPSQNLKRVTDTAIPRDFALLAYPNPFNPSIQIRFSLPTTSAVSLRIFDVNGRLVRELLHAQHAAGEHIVTHGTGETSVV